MSDNKYAIKMVVNGEERNVTFEELALSNNLAQEALVRVLIEKKILTSDELISMMKTVREERYRVSPMNADGTIAEPNKKDE